MKKIIILLSLLLILHFPGLAQFSLYELPMGVSGDPFADTLLNTRAMMVKEKIKKITVQVNSLVPNGSYTSKSVYLNSNGSIDAVKMYFPIGKNKDSTFTVEDSLLYDEKGRMVELITKDTKANVHPLFIAEYINDNEVKYSSIGKFNNNQYVDTLTDDKYFNEKGQMISLRQIRKGEKVSNTAFYYNNDGLFDSIRYENSNWGTFIFQRSEKRKNKVIEMENTFARYRWIYNISGQCINTTYFIKHQVVPGPGFDSKYSSKAEINYYYNADGTLSKVVEKKNNKPTATTVYSYSK